jgi:hypothetical protein
MKKYLYALLILIFLSCSISVVTYASDTGYSEGEVYQGSDGYYYKVIDGKSYKVENGSGSTDKGSLSNVLNNQSNVKVDSNVMENANSQISSLAGTILSVIIYIIFAGLGFTTACDLAYIALPPIRPFLYNPSTDTATNNAGVFHKVVAGQNAAFDANMANQRANQANMYSQQAQNAYASGDMNRARSLQNQANIAASSANRYANYSNQWANKQAQNDREFANNVQQASNRGGNN